MLFVLPCLDVYLGLQNEQVSQGVGKCGATLPLELLITIMYIGGKKKLFTMNLKLSERPFCSRIMTPSKTVSIFIYYYSLCISAVQLIWLPHLTCL